MIETVFADYKEVPINSCDVLRYMQCDAQTNDASLHALAENCIEEMYPLLSCKACFVRFPITKLSEGGMDLGFTATHSKTLNKHLADAHEMILLAATVGVAIDRIIQKYSLLSPSHAVTAQAVGTAAVEGWCDLLCARFAATENKKNNHLLPRFSPGYGDFPLSVQKDIFRILDCGRKIGVTLTDSLLMTPSKSVTAVIGIKKK
ncbi:MAG: Vitamin B12 dependent methionine synthase activation subunit [Clostridia bacterium]|nr:Vitamin B12 dependent methionine synthase activation subunit [Clostridia bacterium]